MTPGEHAWLSGADPDERKVSLEITWADPEVEGAGLEAEDVRRASVPQPSACPASTHDLHS